MQFTFMKTDSPPLLILLFVKNPYYLSIYLSIYLSTQLWLNFNNIYIYIYNHD